MSSCHFASFIDEFAVADAVTIDPGQVLAALCSLPDPRKKRGVRHPFAHLLVIMVCSVLAGATSLVEMAEWASDTAREQLAALGIGAPHATTLARVLQRLDAEALDQLFGAWAQSATNVTAIAIDGKEIRGAKNGGGARVHLLSGIDQATAAVLVQQNVAEKHNEISYFKPLLNGIKELKDVIVMCFVNFKSAISALRNLPLGHGFQPFVLFAYFMRACLTLYDSPRNCRRRP